MELDVCDVDQRKVLRREHRGRDRRADCYPAADQRGCDDGRVPIQRGLHEHGACRKDVDAVDRGKRGRKVEPECDEAVDRDATCGKAEAYDKYFRREVILHPNATRVDRADRRCGGIRIGGVSVRRTSDIGEALGIRHDDDHRNADADRARGDGEDITLGVCVKLRTDGNGAITVDRDTLPDIGANLGDVDGERNVDADADRADGDARSRGARLRGAKRRDVYAADIVAE